MSIFRRLQMIINARARDWSVAGWPRQAHDTATRPQEARSASQPPETATDLCKIARRVTDGRFECSRPAGHPGPCAPIPWRECNGHCTLETCIAPDCIEGAK